MVQKDILDVLSPNVKKIILNNDYKDLQEIRIKADKPLILEGDHKEYVTNYCCSLVDISIIMQKIMNYSLYAFDEELRQGYITMKGGHRVGICGNCIIENNKIKTIKNISSLNIRVCTEVLGCSDKIFKYITEKGEVLNTIIISPPKCGKTTILRDMARNISDGNKYLNNPSKVCIVDERSEIGSLSRGSTLMDLGIRTDILDNCPKSAGIMMAIRSMSPDIIVCDEIGTYKDMESILSAICSGIKLVTSIHGYDVEDLFNKIVFKEIMENKVFDRGVVLSEKKVGKIKYIYDFKRKINIWEE
ncbi:MAG: stage III sporulation protein AA [Clostridiaceae bacterium]